LPPFFRILDTDGDGRLSKEELAKLSDKFGELDRNRDGQLDPSELFGPPPEGGRRPEGDRPPPEGGRRPDGDRPPRAEGDAPRGRGNGPLGGEIFKRLDRNGDGKLVADELPPRVRVNFEKADANGDGALDENEFRQATADAFRREGRGAQPSP
jgi:Ca2+-binding EF-hand superfamily protein